MTSSTPSLLGLRNFRFLLMASSISFLGSSIQFVARGWLALKITGEASSVGWVFALSMIPNVLSSPFVGVLIDRLSRKHLIVAIDIFRALVLGIMAVVFYQGYGHVAALYVMTLLLSVGDSVYSMLSPALGKEIIPAEKLLQGNSWLASWNQIGAVLGVGLGGLLLAWFAEWQVFAINMGTFLLSVSLTSRLKMPSRQGEGVQRKRLFQEMRDGLRYVSEHRYIILPYSLLTSYNFTLRTLNVLLGVFIVEVLRGDVIGFGVIDAAFAVGAILGNLLLTRLAVRYGKEKILSIGLFGLGLTVFAFSQSASLLLCIFFYGCIGIMYQSRVIVVTETQRLVDSNKLGRVQSLFFVVDSVIAFFSFILISHASEAESPKWLYLLPVGLLFLASLAARMLPSSSRITTSGQTLR